MNYPAKVLCSIMAGVVLGGLSLIGVDSSAQARDSIVVEVDRLCDKPLLSCDAELFSDPCVLSGDDCYKCSKTVWQRTCWNEQNQIECSKIVDDDGCGKDVDGICRWQGGQLLCDYTETEWDCARDFCTDSREPEL